ncbi:CoxG family protein [Schinkia azotoformans]|uniref:CoxG family protein n=1 Tax=Schinkia azotoformans TaxID=1454 RepID=UPI002DBB289F|nr:SRPBCC family protein [Schinkia azotoformans]MEC1721466.1 SRPBCC family protein [Schinkia azotoformans]MED4415741.1 SRPBCC family protein [Schinkia azotoformans]
MPAAIESGRVELNIETMWNFIKDMGNWAPCMPGYVSFEEIDENISIWTLKGDVKIFKRKVDFHVTVTERVAPDTIAFTLVAEKEGIKGEGIYKAVPIGSNATDLEFRLNMEGKGMAKKVVDALMAKVLPRYCRELKENLIEVLETQVKPVVSN